MDDWKQNSRLVLTKIEELSRDQKELREGLYALRVGINENLNRVSNELVMLKTKAAVWGGLAGTTFSVVIGTLVQLLFGGHHHD